MLEIPNNKSTLQYNAVLTVSTVVICDSSICASEIIRATSRDCGTAPRMGEKRRRFLAAVLPICRPGDENWVRPLILLVAATTAFIGDGEEAIAGVDTVVVNVDVPMPFSSAAFRRQCAVPASSNAPPGNFAAA